MRKLSTSVIVALGLFLSAFITSSAMAGSYSIGIIGATGTIDTTGSEQEGNVADGAVTTDEEKTSTSISEGLVYGSLFAEYTFGEDYDGSYAITLGASYTPLDASMGAKSRTDTTSEDTTNADNSTGTYTAEAEISGHATIYIEPTFMPTDNFGVYLKGGVARVTVNSLESIALGENSSAYGDESVLGAMYGGGIKVIHDSGLLFKLEYISIDYETVKMTSGTGNQNIITAEPEQEALRLGIGYQF